MDCNHHNCRVYDDNNSTNIAVAEYFLKLYDSFFLCSVSGWRLECVDILESVVSFMWSWSDISTAKLQQSGSVIWWNQLLWSISGTDELLNDSMSR